MKRYRIGLMVGDKSIDYVYSVRMGIQNTLEESGHVLITISDLISFHSRTNAVSYFRVAFEVAGRLGLDAIIVPAGIIASYLVDDRTYLKDFLQILERDKTIVIERKIDGYRCVEKDNAPGMHACMRHLIEECGFTKIAFLGGPESSKGASEREDIYYEEMAAHGLDTPSSLLEHGDFSGECGDAVFRLLDNNPGLEAIACCCDLEARTAYRDVRKRGLIVGEDIAITGFDDDQHAPHMNPPLSTVHMTGYDLGCMAAREAIRLCEGKEQEETCLSSSFVARASCGESSHGLVEKFRSFFHEDPYPVEKAVDSFVESTISMASRHTVEDFRTSMTELFNKTRVSYLQHKSNPMPQDQLFSAQDLGELFNQSYREYMSLEGFCTTGTALLQAIVEESPEEDMRWAIEQVANLHLSISRTLNAEMMESKAHMARREWLSVHMTDDALRESTNPKYAYKLILKEFRALGVRQADIFLLPDPLTFLGSRTFALSDTIVPIGRLADGKVKVLDGNPSISLQELLDYILPRHGAASSYAVGGLMAGDELVGILAMDGGTLDVDGQLIASLNLGLALKHLQMIATERETNELLSKSNLLLEHQSHYDEMTGVLNRRGFMSKLGRMLNQHKGDNGALFYLDLDGLKTINDTYGHDCGDEAIKQTTHVLDAFLPADSLLGRLGGDEFVAFCIVREESELETLGKSVDEGMHLFNQQHSYPFELSISYGGVFFPITDSAYSNITQSLATADERLYQMKKSRRSSRRYQA